MLNRNLAGAIAAALLAPTVALAANPAPASQLGLAFDLEPSRLTREEVQRALTEPVGVADGWRFVGGEAGWIIEVPRLKFTQGRLVHADECLFKQSGRAAMDSGPLSNDVYGGA